MKSFEFARLCRFFSLLLCCCFVLISCAAGGEKSAEDAVASLLALCEEVPDGILYHSDAERGDVGYLSGEAFDLLYGEGAAEHELSLVEDYALYLSSFATPFEVAVFRCYERSDADRLGAILLNRSDFLKVCLRECGLYEAYGESIHVTVTGRYALLILSPESFSDAELSGAVR